MTRFANILKYRPNRTAYANTVVEIRTRNKHMKKCNWTKGTTRYLLWTVVVVQRF